MELNNLKIERKGNSIVVTITDVNADLGLSSTGKTRRVASTEGNISIPGTENGSGQPLVIGLNAYRKV